MDATAQQATAVLTRGAGGGRSRRRYHGSAEPGAVVYRCHGKPGTGLATTSLLSSTRFIELDAEVWSNNTVRVMARNFSAAMFDLVAATLSVG
ncbi:MAG: hypothetical protein JWO24_4184 [Rhodospirillales bacterium]|nr:hypothetical protein [Rhodospirillales bacterium]